MKYAIIAASVLFAFGAFADDAPKNASYAELFDGGSLNIGTIGGIALLEVLPGGQVCGPIVVRAPNGGVVLSLNKTSCVGTRN